MTFYKLTDYNYIKEIRRIEAEELSVEWEIGNFLSKPYGRGDWYDSPEFTFGDKSWRLSMWPNGTDETQSSGWIGLHLGRCDGGPPKTFHVSVGISRSGEVEMEKKVRREFSNYGGWLLKNFCSRLYLIRHRSRLMSDSYLRIRCTIKIPAAFRGLDVMQRSDQTMLKNEEESEATLKEQAVNELQSSLKNLLKREEDSDVIINVQGKEFRAHRLILQMRSPVFQAMFAHDMVEKQRGIVTMDDCDPDTFPSFLQHIYAGSIEMISGGNVFNLYATSEKYDLQLLKKACSEFIKNNLTVSTFCDAMTVAIKYNDEELRELATEFYCDNSLDIVKTAEWQVFLAENPTVGNELYIKQLTSR